MIPAGSHNNDDRRREGASRDSNSTQKSMVMELQSAIKARDDGNPKYREILNCNIDKLSLADLQDVLAKLKVAKEEVLSDEPNGGIVSVVIDGIVNCCKGLFIKRDPAEDKMVNVALNGLGGLRPLNSEINQMAILADKVDRNNTKPKNAHTTMIG